jgi:hypothetical protein
MLLSPQQVLKHGLTFLGMRSTRWSDARMALEFHRHYGSSPLDLAEQWHDLTLGDHLPKELQLNKKEKSEKGLKRFFVAHFFLWAYPKNASMLSSRFKGACDKHCQGEPLWKWIRRIAALKSKKIVWDDNVANPKNLEIFTLSLDGTDYKMNETKHKTLPRDNGACSHKMKHAAAKYEIAMAVHRPKCVHIAGPFKGGTHDLEMFRRGGLKEKLQALNVKIRNFQRTKLAIVDRGYTSQRVDEKNLLSVPNSMGSNELERFKSRARLRHETFNGRLKCFGSLSAQTFRHGFDKHKFVFEAVVVTVQHQMDNGSPIFAA